VRDPLDDYEKINLELEQYSEKLTFKHKIVVANKMDLSEAPENLKRFQEKFSQEIFPISAVTKDGVEPLITKIAEILCHQKENKT